MFFKVISLATLIAVCSCQDYQDFQNVGRPAPHRLGQQEGPKPTPVPILKQINRHNEDGSYTYGYEGADGSFKIETKLANGEVKGKYGYTDETGKVRVVEYGANKYGFQPVGEGITVAPPTLVDETTDKNGRRIADYEEEEQQQPQQPQYRPKAKAAVQPQYYQYEQVQEAPRIATHHRAQPNPQHHASPSQFSAAPTRLQIPGAVQSPSHDVVYAPRPRPARIEPADYEDVGPQTFPHTANQPQRPAIPSQLLTSISAPRPESKPIQSYQQPQQQLEYQPKTVHYQQQQQPKASSHHQGSSSLLDQLAKDYALPQSGSAPLHDITFGYY